MTDILRDLRDYADRLSVQHDIGAVTLQVCDRSTDRHRVVQLFNLRVSEEASWTYEAKNIFAQDPFTDVELNEAADVAYSDRPILPSDVRIKRQQYRCGTYWSFLDHFGLQVEGVSTRRLRRGVFTIAGFLRDGRRSYDAPLDVDLMAETSTVLHNMMAAELLRGTVRSNAGLIGFQHLLERAEEAARDPADLLSPREMQVARLVALGQQTKQVAYQLSLSEHTIENHLRRIYGKLGIHNRAALAHLLG